MRSIPEPLLPFARAVRLRLRYAGARRQASSSRTFLFRTPPVFVIGCGRSGTTILGDLLQSHPQTQYLFEPYHLWTAVDPRTDMLHLFQQHAPAACVLTADDATPPIAQRFSATFGRIAAQSPSQVLIEKTPINALRLSYLDAIAPGCRFIHIVRDGVDVARSIARLATTNTYRIAGKPNFNQWWGENDAKWRLLSRDGASLGYHPLDTSRLDTEEARGAYEWIVSLREVLRYRYMLGDRLIEIRHSDLIESPRDTLGRIATFTRIGARRDWLEDCALRVQEPRRAERHAIALPPAMAEDFNELQRVYGFHGFAIAVEGAKTTPQRDTTTARRPGMARPTERS